MIIPPNSNYAPWKYVEVARYIPRLERVIRFRDKDKNPIMLEWGSEVQAYSEKYGNTGIYTSVFHFNSKNLDEASRMSSLYFDMDAEDLEDSLLDTEKLYRHLADIVGKENLRLYFTGSKGFHIEVEAMALGISPSNELHVIFRYIAERLKEELELSTMDFAVYDSRRMWRLPYSIHQKTNLYKTELPSQALSAPMERIKEFASENRRRTPPNPTFSIAGNEWYKAAVAEYEAKIEEEQRASALRRMDLFNKYGTTLLDGHSNTYIQKVWNTAIEELKKTEFRNNTLSRQAYKVYLVHLESNKALDDVTKTLYDIGIEIGLESREISATLESAERAARNKYETDPKTAYG